MGRGGFGGLVRVWIGLGLDIAKNGQHRDKMVDKSHYSPLQVTVNDENEQKEGVCFQLPWYGGAKR